MRTVKLPNGMEVRAGFKYGEDWVETQSGGAQRLCRSVEAYLETPDGKPVVAGKAVCSPTDRFTRKEGRKIALGRLLWKLGRDDNRTDYSNGERYGAGNFTAHDRHVLIQFMMPKFAPKKKNIVGSKLLCDITITYFKETGKFYTEEKVHWAVNPVAIGDVPYMNDVFDRVRRLNVEGKLPGLQSGRWSGPILVDCDKGFPALLIAREKDPASAAYLSQEVPACSSSVIPP